MLFLSIHPDYVNAIVEGRKTIELRKRKPNVEIGSGVVIYATTPRCEIVATAQVSRILVKSPDILWRSVGKKAAVSRTEFTCYFEDRDIAVAIFLANVSVLDRPISLDELRQWWSKFHPPQQYRYLTEEQQEFVYSRRSSLVVA